MSFDIYDFTSFNHWVDTALRGACSPFWAVFWEMLIVGVLFLAMYAVVGLYLVLAERKVCAFMQNRIGPNRVAHGVFSRPLPTLSSLLMKEIISIREADKLLFNLAPFIVIITSFLALAAIPFAKGLHPIDLNIGVFYIMAVSSMGVVGVLLAGWSSNSKYSLLGAMRSGAQIIAYELSVGLSLIAICVLAGSMRLSVIVERQSDLWFIFKGHFPAITAFVIYLIAGTAETNRGPFDLAEAESELTGGYHTEYSGIKFAFFFLAEYMNMFIIASIAATIFLGGWMPLHFPGLEGFNHVMDFIPPVIWYIGKTAFLVIVMMWFKWTFPAYVLTNLLNLEWKFLLPISLFNILLMAFIVLMGWYIGL